jgi:hypothetical protein
MAGATRNKGTMKTWARVLLVLAAVGGGCSGVVAALPLFSSLSTQGLRYALFVFIVFAVYSSLVAAGLLFVYDANRTRPMLLAFALQIPWVDLPGFRYQIYSLLYAAVTFGPPHGNGRIGTYIEWSANLGTHVELRIGGLPVGDWSVGANLFALMIALLLLRYAGITSGSKSQVPES